MYCGLIEAVEHGAGLRFHDRLTDILSCKLPNGRYRFPKGKHYQLDGAVHRAAEQVRTAVTKGSHRRSDHG